MGSTWIASLVAIAVLLPNQAGAQSAPELVAPSKPIATASKDEDTVTLSIFTVNADKDAGYQANDTIVAGRLKTNLLKTPNDISVQTREFLDDLAPMSLVTVGNWQAGADRAFPTEVNDSRDFGQQTSYRGLGTGADTRNGFRVDVTSEAYAVERVEAARGSNALLFGDGPSGGQTNFSTKQARFRNSLETTLRFDRFGTNAAYVDLNRRPAPNLAVRLNAQSSRGRSWTDRSRDDRDGATLAVTFRPWRNSEIRYDGGYDYNVRTMLNRYQDQVSLYDGAFAISAPLAANPAAATGVSRFTADKIVWNPAQGHLYNYRNFGQTTGSTLLLVDDARRPNNFPTISRREFLLAAPDETNRNYSRTNGLYYNQALSNGISFEFAAAESGIIRKQLFYQAYTAALRRDVNAVLPGFANDNQTAITSWLPNPNYGKLYADGFMQRATYNQQTNSLRASVAYEFTKIKGIRQLIGINASSRISWFYPNEVRYGRTNGAVIDRHNAANQVTVWRYLDRPSDSVNFPEAGADSATIKSYLNRHDTSFTRNQGVQLSTVGYYLEDKLTVVAGVRRDEVDSLTRAIGTYDALGDVATYNDTRVLPKYKNIVSVGATYFPIRQLGFYVNQGGGFRLFDSSSPLLPGRIVPFAYSTTKSYGVRGVLLDGKVNARLGFYDTYDSDRASAVTLTDINAIWGAMNHPEKNIQSPFSTFADTLQYHGRGTEAELTLNLTNRVRLNANFTLPKADQKNARPDTIAYVNKNRNEWENAAKGLDISGAPLTGTDAISPANQTLIAGRLPAVYNLMTAAAEGRSVDGTFKYRANFFGVVDLPGERLHGLSLGGGANVYGPRQIGNQPNQPYNYIDNEASYTATAFASYKFKLFGRATSVQLNVENLLDWNRPVYNNTSVFTPAGATTSIAYRNAYNYVAPRNVVMTLKHAF